MADLTGWPTDGAEGSVSSEARWRKMARLWAPSGVANGLVPTLGAGVINVTAGAAWVDGHYCELTSPASETNSANGLLVVRFTPADNSFEMVYRDGVSTPTQSDATWELPIALMTAGAMTDRRQFTGGALGYAQITANQSGITTEVDITGLAVTVSVPANRRLRISAQYGISSSVVNDRMLLRIKEGSTVLGRADNSIAVLNVVQSHLMATVVLPSAGVHTYKLTAERAAGTGTCAVVGDTSGRHSWLLVEDIGSA